MEFKNDGAAKPVTISPERVQQLVGHVLKRRFPGDFERQQAVPRGVRLNICCPYCGDSKDARKKRGNVYVNWLYFKCYNGGCEAYKDLLTFLNDFECDDILTDEERLAAKLNIDESRKNSRLTKMQSFELNIEMLANTDFSKALIKRSDFMKQMRLWEIFPDSPTGVYLTKRRQVIDNKFAWDNYRKRLFIFNLDKSGEWIFSCQTRQFGEMEKRGMKYLTYNIEKMWKTFMRVEDPNFLESMAKLNHLSTIFGLLRVNFNQMVTIFEGPMDHFLYGNNSVALCSIGNEWPFDMENQRWFQDDDDAGREKALEVIAAGGSAFMWKKFRDDHYIPRNSKKFDYNDLVVYQWANNKRFDDLEDYFSTHHLDGINV